jgi:hypothetical protein
VWATPGKEARLRYVKKNGNTVVAVETENGTVVSVQKTTAAKADDFRQGVLVHLRSK